MNYADIKRVDVANGPGVRVSLFVSGCTHHCKGCFNKEAWNFDFGTPFTENTIETIIKYLEPEYISGLTVLGGEPLDSANQAEVLKLLRIVKKRYPEKSIWCFTGYDFEEDIIGYMLKKYNETRELLSYIDVIVDGKFMEELKNVNLRFKGSSNQKTIMVQESLRENKTVLYEL